MKRKIPVFSYDDGTNSMNPGPMTKRILSFDYPDARCVVVCGDIHGAFEEMVFKLCVQYGMTDTVLIVAGDCGFGFEMPGYYEQVFMKISRRLTKANNWIVMIRGNHDDPAYFREQRIHHERFRCIPDYSIITACGHTILGIGGAVSIDRASRLAVDSRPHSSRTASYWEDEMPYYDDKALADINANYKVNVVVTHSSPSFCELITKDGLMSWARRDDALLEDCEQERAIFVKIFDSLIAAGQPVTHWFYGHFHQSWSSIIHEVLFSMLDIMELKELRMEVRTE